MKVGLAFIFVLLVSAAQAQLLDNSRGNALEDEWLFSKDFIEANGICHIRVEHSIKPDGSQIEKTGDAAIYHFGPSGEITSYQRISSLFGRSDTTNVSQIYLQEELVCVRHETLRSIVTDTLIYDDSNVTVIRFKQDISKELGKIKVHSESRSTTWPNDTTKIILSRNDLGLPYYRETWVSDGLGFLQDFQSEFIISGEKKRIQYRYDKFARISERIANEKGDVIIESFHYDPWDNLEKVVRKRNGVLIHSQELLLSANGLPEAILSRKEQSEEIVISKLFYEYCE